MLGAWLIGMRGHVELGSLMSVWVVCSLSKPSRADNRRPCFCPAGNKTCLISVTSEQSILALQTYPHLFFSIFYWFIYSYFSVKYSLEKYQTWTSWFKKKKKKEVLCAREVRMSLETTCWKTTSKLDNSSCLCFCSKVVSRSSKSGTVVPSDLRTFLYTVLMCTYCARVTVKAQATAGSREVSLCICICCLCIFVPQTYVFLGDLIYKFTPFLPSSLSWLCDLVKEIRLPKR